MTCRWSRAGYGLARHPSRWCRREECHWRCLGAVFSSATLRGSLAVIGQTGRPGRRPTSCRRGTLHDGLTTARLQLSSTVSMGRRTRRETKQVLTRRRRRRRSLAGARIRPLSPGWGNCPLVPQLAARPFPGFLHATHLLMTTECDHTARRKKSPPPSPSVVGRWQLENSSRTQRRSRRDRLAGSVTCCGDQQTQSQPPLWARLGFSPNPDLKVGRPLSAYFLGRVHEPALLGRLFSFAMLA